MADDGKDVLPLLILENLGNLDNLEILGNLEILENLAPLLRLFAAIFSPHPHNPKKTTQL